VTDPIADALHEFVPPFEAAEGDWKGIVYAATMAARVADRQSRRIRLQRRRRPLLLAVALLAVVALATAAVAVVLGAFNGIGAAQHPQTGGDVIDPATAAAIKGNLVGIQLDTARHIGQLPRGQNIYVITGTQNDLCTVVGPPNPEWWCNDPLSDSHPATIYNYRTGNNDPTRWITFGIALDGVTSVSFQTTQAADGGPAGPEATVPVNDNLWTYKTNNTWPPYLLQSVTAHFADGTTVVEPATGTNCAAC
jgi:hypothetical protein